MSPRIVLRAAKLACDSVSLHIVRQEPVCQLFVLALELSALDVSVIPIVHLRCPGSDLDASTNNWSEHVGGKERECKWYL